MVNVLLGQAGINRRQSCRCCEAAQESVEPKLETGIRIAGLCGPAYEMFVVPSIVALINSRGRVWGHQNSKQGEIMRIARLVFAVATALVAAAAVASSAWGAHPTLLIGGAASTNAEITGSSGKSTLQTVSGKTVTATGSTIRAKLTSETKGSFAITFVGVAAAGVKCTGLSNTTTGEITAEGEFHLVYDNTTTLAAALAFLLTPVHFSCSAKLVVVSGCVLILKKPINTSVAAGAFYEAVLKASGGKDEDTKYVFNTGEAEKTCVLSSTENEGTSEEAGENVEEGKLKISVGGVNVASEIMA
jgi:hypothetical protein